jgi:transposase-like protein
MPSGPYTALSPAALADVDEFDRCFPDDESCLVFLWRTVHSPDGETAYCVRCRAYKAFRRYVLHPPRRSWTCRRCGFHFHPTAGTIFERSGTPLRAWFYAIYLVSHSEERVSARRLQRELGVTYKTAWRILRLVREQMSRGSPEHGPFASLRTA